MKFTKMGLMAAFGALAVICTLPTLAQDSDPPAIAARIAYLSGNVSLEAQGAEDWSVAPLNYPMVSGDRMYVDNGARAIIQSGSTDVRVWGGSDVTLTNLNQQYEQIGIAQGSIRVRVYAIDPDNTIEVDTPSGAVIIQYPGDYRVNVYPDQQASLVQVNAGTVQITGPGVNQEVDQGEAVQLYGTNPVEVGMVDMPGYDALDNWSIGRDHHIQVSVSARYVSHWVPGYDDLDDYGGWTAATDYGPMWFPRTVAAGWQPYTVGHWAYVAPWGYTWVDDAAWGYAPFHYGRWVQWQGRWGWVPGPPAVRPVYAPAFVAFVGGGPGFSLGVSFGGGGVAAWFPLGVAEPFVPWYHCSPAYVRTVNVTNVNITVIHNVTIVNNYNTFITRVSNARTVNEIQVSNVTYMNRAHVVAVPANAMTSGARVQQAAVHLNPQQQQALVRAPISVARPPVPPPAHPTVGARANVSRPAARPVLMTPHGRAAATPTANTAHFNAKTLPKPAPPTALKPATHAVVPNVHPAAPGNRPGQPANAARPGQPANNAARPGTPARNEGRPGAPANAARPGTPASNAGHPGAPANNAARPGTENRPNQPGSRPNQPVTNGRPAAPATNRPGTTPVRPENNKPVTPANRPAPETKPAPTAARPETHAAPVRPAPQAARPTAPAHEPATKPATPATRPATHPAARPTTEPQNRTAPARPATQAHPAPGAKNPPPNKKEEKKPPKEQNPPQR